MSVKRRRIAVFYLPVYQKVSFPYLKIKQFQKSSLDYQRLPMVCPVWLFGTVTKNTLLRP